MTCHNCGLPEGALLKNPGRTISITLRAENRMRRDRTVSVWVCTDECAAQAFGLSKYGNTPSKWPVNLAQVRALAKKEFQ